MSRQFISCLFGLVLLIASGCDSQSSQGPISITYGQDACSECGATIDDPRFTGQYHFPDGPVKIFGDPGCLLRALQQEASAPLHVYFRDYNGDTWLAAEDAWFAQTPQITSPSGYDWAAFASFGDGQEAVTSAGGGELIPYAKAKERIAAMKDQQ